MCACWDHYFDSWRAIRVPKSVLVVGGNNGKRFEASATGDQALYSPWNPTAGPSRSTLNTAVKCRPWPCTRACRLTSSLGLYRGRADHRRRPPPRGCIHRCRLVSGCFYPHFLTRAPPFPTPVCYAQAPARGLPRLQRARGRGPRARAHAQRGRAQRGLPQPLLAAGGRRRVPDSLLQIAAFMTRLCAASVCCTRAAVATLRFGGGLLPRARLPIQPFGGAAQSS